MIACDSQKEEVIKIQEKTQKTTNGPEVCDQSCLLCISVILIRLRVLNLKFMQIILAPWENILQ